MFTPPRQRGVEILDSPDVDPEIRARSIADVTTSNRLLGGLRAARIAVRDATSGMREPVTLLDIGTGLADIPSNAARDAAARGHELRTIGVDEAFTLLAEARGRIDDAVCANALDLPFRDRSIDIVMCSQVLHHFETRDAERLIREMHRVARRAVVVSDLRRSRLAAIGFWTVSWLLRFHRVTRHDGVVSVMRGFTADELSKLVQSAAGAVPVVQRRLGFRITARWMREAA